MKLLGYIRDRLWFYIIAALSFGLVLLFLTAYRVSGQLIAFISSILLMFIVFEELTGFLRKRRFYNDMREKLDGLDQKFLIHEMINKPSFLEGEILYEALCDANKSMCEKVSEYKRSSADFRDFIEMWVHEVKLPLASLQLMAHNHRDEFGEKYIEQLRRIDDYTDQVLYYARSENAEKDYIIKETSLKRTVANVAVKNREALQLAGASIETDGLDAKVMTDGKWLEFMLGQFMANSLKYTVENREPVIRIYAEELDDKVLLHFRDNGAGIPESDIPRVFDKSFTGENGHTYAKSTGMGLYIVKSLCDRLGHGISADSVRGSFTEMTISFAQNDHYLMTG
ncbi:MAG: sensor histidine kinase [Ruminococcus sp.]|uniref:sensor histidine kinase n=1 Tax=Ruminococcus sp. TaxID=41978 RepID=UPI0025FC8872|nr:sensor histidine kinase [Ruminococcus sp.]MBR5681795.1 sensor histidine kinase [Ruminococcus sp.]